MKIYKFIATFTFGCIAFKAISLGIHNSSLMTYDAIKERTSSSALVQVADESSIGLDPNMPVGERVYHSKCSACHEAGVAGAPKVHTNEWDERLSKGIDALVESVVNGLGAMPPMGTCLDCSNDDLKLAIEYMLPEGKS